MLNNLYDVIKGFLNDYNIGIADLLLILGATSFLLTIILLVVIIRQISLNSKYKKFMSGSDGRSLEEEIREKIDTIKELETRLTSVESSNEKTAIRLNEMFQKIGIVKYDAFEEMGGKMSFALALLSDKNTGFVINAMHSREGCYTYIKEIINGQSKVLLAKEEKEALETALLSEIQK